VIGGLGLVTSPPEFDQEMSYIWFRRVSSLQKNQEKTDEPDGIRFSRILLTTEFLMISRRLLQYGRSWLGTMRIKLQSQT
jgi:hypothetical protein